MVNKRWNFKRNFSLSSFLSFFSTHFELKIISFVLKFDAELNIVVVLIRWRANTEPNPVDNIKRKFVRFVAIWYNGEGVRGSACSEERSWTIFVRINGEGSRVNGTRGRVSQRRFTAGCVNTRKRADFDLIPVRDARWF